MTSVPNGSGGGDPAQRQGGGRGDDVEAPRPAAATAAAADADADSAAARANDDNDDKAAAPTDGLRRRRRRDLIRKAVPKKSPARHLYEMRPDVVTQKTRKPQWRQLKSRWRWFHALFFWAGPPAYLMWRIWPVLLLNMCLASLDAIDHLLRVTAKPGDGVKNSILPNISGNVIDAGLGPMIRFMLFATSMILTLRLSRVYERWWLVRQSFSAVGSTATSLAQRVTAWAEASGCARQQQIAADIRRWLVVYHFSIMHVCQNASAIHPDGARLLEPEELALYSAARKGRQIAADRLVQLLYALDLPTVDMRIAAEQLLQRAVASAGACTGVRFQSLPYSLTLISTGFVELFLLALVLLMVQASDGGVNLNKSPESTVDTVFTVVVVLGLYFGICVLFLGADEVANQLEDPFPWLPLYDIVQTTERDVMRVPAELAALDAAAEDAARRRQRREEEGEGEEEERRRHEKREAGETTTTTTMGRDGGGVVA